MMVTGPVRHFRIPRVRVLAALVLLVIATSIVAGATDDTVFGLFKSDKRSAEQVLGAGLPASASDVHFYRDQPSPDLAMYTAYLRFRTTRDDYLDMMQRLQVRTYPGSAPELRELLPGKWHADPRLRLDWWNPGDDIPDDTAMGQFGVNGWLVAKMSDGNVYVVMHDTGRVDSNT